MKVREIINAVLAEANDSKSVERLKQMLLRYGGSKANVDPSDPDLAKIIQRGILMTGPVRMMIGKPVNCHGNAATLWLNGEGRICTGYALGKDKDIWRQHSWALTADRQIIETTVERIVYFGFVLNDEESKDFVKHNPPCWDERKHYVGSCKDCFDEDGDVHYQAARDLPWSNVSDFAVADENAEPIEKVDFLHRVIIPTEIAQEVAGHDLRYFLMDGVYVMYDDDTDTHYFFA